MPGNFFDLGHPEGGILRITPEAANLWFITQTLTGDPTDNYPGCPGIGPATARKLLKDAGPVMTTLWAVVLAAYEKAGLTESDAWPRPAWPVFSDLWTMTSNKRR